MRASILALVGIIVVLILPLPLAAASDDFGCHEWAVHVGEGGDVSAAVSTDTAVFVGVNGLYIISDGTPIFNDWLLSVWLYQETNGEPGLQRGDEVCDESRDDRESDNGCFC